ncbi:MAG TPA: DNA-processing protein DprA [Steroidobacteraceae bacterium]|nr:DNA-processing protein DprA [Steroidobacteraceae bacterium]
MRLCDEILAWVILTRAPALGAPALAVALERLGSAGGILAASDAARECAGIPAAARAYLERAARVREAERRWLEEPRHHLLPFTDPKYPKLLAGLADRPIALYLAGDLDALATAQVAVVGSRNPSPQGIDSAFEFAHSLAQRGVAITSGLAQGIDTAAHRGALAAQGTTLAILGSGADVIYPSSNRRLCEAIVYEGALVSEFALGTPPRRAHFPRRNRLIAALGLGILVVEAALGSGSLITARAARALGRAVFAIPGSIGNPLSRGCHQLIKSGAKLTETTDDILCGLSFSPFFAGRSGEGAGAASREGKPSGMDKEHKILLDALGFDPVDLDMLIVRTGFKPQAVSSMMLILELEGHVQAAPGGRYARVANRRAGGER